MISKYNNFLINESMFILEAFLSADSDFLSKLDKISRQSSNFSSIVADMILSRINDQDWVSSDILKQDFFKTTDTNDKVSFAQTNRIKYGVDPYTMAGRTDVKVGRAIKYIAKDLYDIKISDKQIEEFVNVYKSIPNEGEPNFQFYISDDIKNGYNTDNYYSSFGTLGNSCMNNHPSFLKIYRNNSDKVRLLVLLDDNGDICGRALVWKLDKSPCEAEYFMDRVYTNRDYEVNKFTRHAEKNGWLYKLQMTYGDLSAVKFRYNGKEILGEISVKINGKHSKYPYMDTLFCLNKDKNELSNVPSWKCYKLCDTGGDRERCSDCDGKTKNKNLCYGCSEGVMALKQAGIEIDVEKGRELDKDKKET